ATVVVGTVIDPDLENELRVTVVATGLGHSEMQAKATAVSLVQSSSQQAEIEEALDYRTLDKPTIIRNSNGSPRDRKVVGGDTSMDYLDVPAFLRRQAD